MRQEIRIGGFGGQGVVTAAFILGKAAAVYDGRIANQTQTYGPEARGGAAKAEVVIADAPIGYPAVLAADMLLILSQEAYNRYRAAVKPGGLVLIEADLVQPDATDQECRRIRATHAAEQLGNAVVTNIVMLGALVALGQPVTREAIIASTLETVPARFRDLNQQALEVGFRMGEECRAQVPLEVVPQPA
jgi:2-oxoglutarate ferredoxin oxidoreductase subunit gamma